MAPLGEVVGNLKAVEFEVSRIDERSKRPTAEGRQLMKSYRAAGNSRRIS
ncbi:hypothetical protein [Rosistilla carotiformis]|nr:hypothetical protein [Rosistilla carotiformis]